MGKSYTKMTFVAFSPGLIFAVLLDKVIVCTQENRHKETILLAPKINVKTDGQENDVQNFMLKLHAFCL